MRAKMHEGFGVLVGFIAFLGIVWFLVNAELGASNPCEGLSGRSDVRCMGYYSMPSAQRR